MEQRDIRDLSFEELTVYLKSIGETSFRSSQIFEWIYQKQAEGFDQMSNLSSGLRARLKKDHAFLKPVVHHKDISSDGTTKVLFELHDGEMVETVLIPTPKRATVCVSTQAGCKFGCRFCASGIGGWKRNLSCAEILGQIGYMQRMSSDRPVSHIVFMGVGEPFDNYPNFMKAVRIINDSKAMNIGARRITVSTCGVIPQIKKLAQEGLQIELAISLHGYDNESRNVLMPVNRKYPFDDLMSVCREYIRSTKRQITFEYILIKDITCSENAVKALKKSFRGIICKMNLIPYNPVSEFDHKTPSKKEIFQFKDRLKQFGVHATVRTPRGKDINGACGQLRHAAVS